MAEYSSLATGKARNKCGNVVFDFYGGIRQFREYQPNPHDPKTEKQLSVRQRISNVGKAWNFLRPFVGQFWTALPKYQNSQNLFSKLNYPVAETLVFDGSEANLVVPVDTYLSHGYYPVNAVQVGTRDASGIPVYIYHPAVVRSLSPGDELIFINVDPVFDPGKIITKVLTQGDISVLIDSLPVYIVSPGNRFAVFLASQNQRRNSTSKVIQL